MFAHQINVSFRVGIDDETKGVFFGDMLSQDQCVLGHVKVIADYFHILNDSCNWDFALLRSTNICAIHFAIAPISRTASLVKGINTGGVISWVYLIVVEFPKRCHVF